MTVEANVVKDIWSRARVRREKQRQASSDRVLQRHLDSGWRSGTTGGRRARAKVRLEKWFAFGSPSCDDDRTGGLSFDTEQRIQVPRQEKAQTNELTLRVVERKGLEAFVVTTRIDLLRGSPPWVPRGRVCAVPDSA